MANNKGIWPGGKTTSDLGEEWDERIDDSFSPNEDVDAQEVSEEEVREIGNLMNSEDDPEGWMSELVDYWEQLPPTSSLTRTEWLRHRLETAKALFDSHRMGGFQFWPAASKRKGQREDDCGHESREKSVNPSHRHEPDSRDGSGNQDGTDDGGCTTVGYACP